MSFSHAISFLLIYRGFRLSHLKLLGKIRSSCPRRGFVAQVKLVQVSQADVKGFFHYSSSVFMNLLTPYLCLSNCSTIHPFLHSDSDSRVFLSPRFLKAKFMMVMGLKKQVVHS